MLKNGRKLKAYSMEGVQLNVMLLSGNLAKCRPNNKLQLKYLYIKHLMKYKNFYEVIFNSNV